MMQAVKNAPLPSSQVATKRDPRIGHLIGVARELAIKSGYEAGERLIDNFGGQRLYVPRKPQPRRASRRQVLKEVDFITAIGADAAETLAVMYGGEHIEVPLRSSLLLKRMTDFLLSTPAPSINQVVAKFDVHRRTVQRLRAQLRRQASGSRPTISPLKGVAAAPLTRSSDRRQNRGASVTPRQTGRREP